MERIRRIIEISYMDHISPGERIEVMRDNARVLLQEMTNRMVELEKDSLTPSHNAQEAKDGDHGFALGEIRTPLDAVVETPHNDPNELNA